MISGQLSNARAASHQAMRDNVLRAVEDIAATGGKMSFYEVAKRAGVARSSLYRCEDLKAIVVDARQAAARFRKAARVRTFVNRDMAAEREPVFQSRPQPKRRGSAYSTNRGWQNLPSIQYALVDFPSWLSSTEMHEA